MGSGATLGGVEGPKARHDIQTHSTHTSHSWASNALTKISNEVQGDSEMSTYKFSNTSALLSFRASRGKSSAIVGGLVEKRMII